MYLLHLHIVHPPQPRNDKGFYFSLPSDFGLGRLPTQKHDISLVTVLVYFWIAFKIVNIFNPRNELEIDPEDFSGRRTPLYLAAKSKQKESVKLLISHGASTKSSCYGKTIEDLIKETIPDLNLVTIELISITFSIELKCWPRFIDSPYH